MIISPYLKAVAAIMTSGIAIKLFKTICRKRKSAINEILFYGANDQEQAKAAGLHNVLYICYMLGHASRTLDVCMPSLKSAIVARCLIKAKRNKVKIRVAVHTLHNSEDFIHLQSLAQDDIEVKVINNGMNVHLAYEFILLDASEDFEDALAVIGSLDYDITRLNLNSDSTMITSDKNVVKTLQKEFHRIWEYSD